VCVCVCVCVSAHRKWGQGTGSEHPGCRLDACVCVCVCVHVWWWCSCGHPCIQDESAHLYFFVLIWPTLKILIVSAASSKPTISLFWIIIERDALIMFYEQHACYLTCPRSECPKKAQVCMIRSGALLVTVALSTGNSIIKLFSTRITCHDGTLYLPVHCHFCLEYRQRHYHTF
jgi:hypothetical protein